jgi:transposase-like protein
MEDWVMEQGKQRRTYKPEFKRGVVERMRAGESPTELALELGVERKVLYRWKAAVETGRGFPGKGHPFPAMGVAVAVPARDGAERIQELETLVGRLTLENRFFKGALQSIEELRRAKGVSSSAASSPKSKR